MQLLKNILKNKLKETVINCNGHHIKDRYIWISQMSVQLFTTKSVIHAQQLGSELEVERGAYPTALSL
jgi:hypothetical protein